MDFERHGEHRENNFKLVSGLHAKLILTRIITLKKLTKLIPRRILTNTRVLCIGH